MKIFNLCALICVLTFVPSLVLAEDSAETTGPQKLLDRVSGSIGLDIVDKYINSAGLVLENQDAITQPYLYINVDIYKPETYEYISKVQLVGGLWNSFHGEQTDAGANSTTPDYYEIDFIFGFQVFFKEQFIFRMTYETYQSPNDGLENVDLFVWTLLYDDAPCWDNQMAIRPYAKVIMELDGKNANGDDAGTNGPDEGVGIIFGLDSYYNIKFNDGPFKDDPIVLGFPLAVGLGFDEYYDNNHNFGYIYSALYITVPLVFIPKDFGLWSATVKWDTYYLGEALESFNNDNVRERGSMESVIRFNLNCNF